MFLFVVFLCVFVSLWVPASVKIAYGFGILGFCFGSMDFFLEFVEIFWIFPLDFLDFYRLVKEFF